MRSRTLGDPNSLECRESQKTPLTYAFWIVIHFIFSGLCKVEVMLLRKDGFPLLGVHQSLPKMSDNIVTSSPNTNCQIPLIFGSLGPRLLSHMSWITTEAWETRNEM